MIVGITFGAFDLLHPGHLYSLYEAKTKCDELIVGLHTEVAKVQAAVMTQLERLNAFVAAELAKLK